MKTDRFSGKDVLVTGGLGFIGSNLSIRLIALGARVTIIDNMLPEHGGNLFNIEPIKDKVNINFGDILSESVMNYLVQGKDLVFHLAGQVSHVLSLSNPYPDIDINIKGTAILMEALKKHNKQATMIYAGTRGVYGSSVRLPVDENAPTCPKGIHEIANLTAEKIVKVYNDIHGIKSVLLRLTNIYGPRAQMKHSHYGVVNWFVRQAIDGETLKVFGDGKILRDFLYVDDCVDAILACAASEKGFGEVLNVGIDEPTSFLELIKTIVEIAGTGSWEFSPYTPERKAQEPGDFYSNIEKIRKIAGWNPKTSLRDGIAKTLAYYRQFREFYW